MVWQAMKRAASLAASLLVAVDPAGACTRAMFVGTDQVVITGRNMDWPEDMRSNLWAFPKGITRDGSAGPNSIKWTSKYGSVIASAYDVGSAEGMNEAGLVANMLYLTEAEYGAADDRPTLAISLWAQYALDRFATVAEAVEALQQNPFRVVGGALPNGSAAQMHLALSDATGDSAILEHIGGKLVIHHSRDYVVMTNSPPFDQQLALDAYWKEIGGLTFLPGTNRASDRFVRASFLIGSLAKTADPAFISAVPAQSFENQSALGVLSVMRAVSTPLGIKTPETPNVSATLWRAVSDQKNKVLFFDSATSPNSFWVPLTDLDLTVGAPVKKLTVTGGRVYSGNAAGQFQTSEPFVFLPARP